MKRGRSGKWLRRAEALRRKNVPAPSVAAATRLETGSLPGRTATE